MKFPCEGCLVSAICIEDCENLCRYIFRLSKDEKYQFKKIKEIPVSKLIADRVCNMPSIGISSETCRLLRSHFQEVGWRIRTTNTTKKNL